MRWAIVALGCAACSAADTDTEVPPACAPLEVVLPDGSCVRPGLGPEDCGAGFVHDGEYGCLPTLPSAPCLPGHIAVPGEAACRPVMPCGSGTWGDIPVDATAVYVDSSYRLGDSDGSARKPWPRIQDAIIAAPSGALVAIAAGSYAEDLRIAGKSLRLWGVCPELVEIVGSSLVAATLIVAEQADGTEIHGIAIRGPTFGVAVSGSLDVLLDRLWVHDTESRGIAVQNSYGPTSTTITGSLVEQCRDAGVRISGSQATVEATVVRGTRPRAADQRFGRGISIQLACTDAGACDPNARAAATVRGSLVEQNHAFGIFVAGSDAHVETTVVRGTLPDAFDQRFGSGVTVQLGCTDAVCDPSTRSRATVTQSFIEASHDVGLMVGGSDAVVERTVVRGTQPRASDQRNGRGINVQDCSAADGCAPTARATTNLSRVLVERSHDIGVGSFGSDLTVELTVVRDTMPRATDQRSGRGINAQLACNDAFVCDPDAPSNLVLRTSLIERNRDVGVFVSGSTGTLFGSVVRSTAARSDGSFGDGVAVFSENAPASAVLQLLRIEDSARAGVSSFGSFATLELIDIRCAAIAIAGERYLGQDFGFDDRGQNRCGCPESDGACVAVSPGLAPPEALGGVQ